MPRVKWLKCHRCGELFSPWTCHEVDDRGYNYCSTECWREEMDERARADKEDYETEEWWFETALA